MPGCIFPARFLTTPRRWAGGSASGSSGNRPAPVSVLTDRVSYLLIKPFQQVVNHLAFRGLGRTADACSITLVVRVCIVDGIGCGWFYFNAAGSKTVAAAAWYVHHRKLHRGYGCFRVGWNDAAHRKIIKSSVLVHLVYEGHAQRGQHERQVDDYVPHELVVWNLLCIHERFKQMNGGNGNDGCGHFLF